MSDDFRKQLYRNFNQKETDELIEIWQKHDPNEWTELTFDVIRELLQERLGELPPQNKPSIAPNTQGTTVSKFCHLCGREAQTKYVNYHQNIGMIVRRFSDHIEGYFCKDCSNEYFSTFTFLTLFLGWWGLNSFFITLFILPNNIINYIGTLRLESPDSSEPRQKLTDDVTERIKPYIAELFQRVNAGEEMELVAKSIAQRANASSGHVIITGLALARSKQNQIFHDHL